MFKLINKIFLKESQSLCSGTIKLAKTKVEICVTDAKFETLKHKEGTR